MVENVGWEGHNHKHLIYICSERKTEIQINMSLLKVMEEDKTLVTGIFCKFLLTRYKYMQHPCIRFKV